MTLWELLRACWRYAPVVLVGALLTAVGGYVATSDDGVYYTRSELAFLAPRSPNWPNALRAQSDSVIVTAGAVARTVMGPGELAKFASPDVTLIGMGVRDGWSLRLPDTGGQWASNFTTQRLVLEVVGPTREAVAARQQEVTQEVAATLAAMQSAEGADPAGQITMVPTPESTVISHVAGSRVRAAGMTAMLGASVTLAWVMMMESRRRGRGRIAAPPRAAAAAASSVGTPSAVR